MHAVAHHPGRILHELQHRDECGDADRHIDQEHPAPGVVIGDPAAQRRPDDRREDHRDRHQRERFAALRGLECVQDHGLLARLKPTAEQPLEQPEHDQLRQARRDPAQERAHGEHHDAHQEVAFAPDQPAQPPGDRHNNSVCHQIRRERPCRVIVARRQRPRDIGKADIDDGGIQDLHERCQRRGTRDQPDAAPRPPRDVLKITHTMLTLRRRPRPGALSARPIAPAAVAGSDPCRCRSRSSPAHAARS